jgi:hypothetical protein
MPTDHTICAICAWRATCNKKFYVDGTTTTRCLEFTRDLTLKAREEETEPKIAETSDK